MTQAQALRILKTGRNILLLGEAGAGKTYILRQYLDYLADHSVSVGITASTGIAATHIGGTTIHSWSGIGIRDSLSQQQIEAIADKHQLKSQIQRAQVLVIDEISMLSAKQFDAVDQVTRAIRQTQAPFGGLQVILVGDFFQLPPISQEPEPPFVFTSQAWEPLGLKVCYLDEQHRQADEALLSVLSAIRSQTIEESHFEIISERIKTDQDFGREAVHLYTHNANVDELNESALADLPGDEHEFIMKYSGKRKYLEGLVRGCLAPEALVLKLNAKVMFVKNNPERGYVNGTTGKVTGFNPDGWPVVANSDGHEFIAEPEQWSIEEDGVPKATIAQVPLRLAWAITVHKSQGMTLDRAVIDLTRSFAPGMGYVALSRVQTLDGLILRGINNTAFAVHPLVTSFEQRLRALSEATSRQFENLTDEQIKTMHESFLTKAANSAKQKDQDDTYEQTRKLVETNLSLTDIANGREMTVDTIIKHLGVIAEEYPETDISRFRPKRSIINKVQKAYNALPAGERMILSKLKSACPSVSWQDIKLALVYVE
ncbi:AAA family ATPase [Candidatus Berkelbacteria bacterium]|nr:AAA family ATPase [Candidatus Berkelbacteria bacterium]